MTAEVNRSTIRLIAKKLLNQQNIAISSHWGSPEHTLIAWEFWLDASDEDILRIIKTIPEQMKAACQPRHEGHPALHSAVAANRNEIILTEVIRLSPDVNFQNHNGNTPLHLAAQRCERPETIQLLFNKGAKPNILNKKGQTPLESGKEWNGNPAVLKIIADNQ